MSFSVRKATVVFLLNLSLPVFIFLSLSAAELTLEPKIGFNGLFQLGHPFPLTVDLTNSGAPVEGVLEVKVWKGGPGRGVEPYPLYYQRGLFLSAQSRKSIQFTVDPDSLSRPLTVSFSGPRFNLSKEVDLRRNFSPSPLILLLTENSVSPLIPLPPGSSTPLVSLSVRELPNYARAFQGISAVILYEQSLRDLSKQQMMALEGWLSSGGRMVILGSMHYALYQEPSISRFLPVRVTGLKRMASFPSLEKIYGGKVSSLRNLWVQDSRLSEGTMLIEEEGTPILVEVSRGKGKVLYLSLDVGRPPVSRWEGLLPLFRDLLGSPAERRWVLETSWDESVFSQLLSNPSFISTYVPARSFFFWLLIYLGGLGLLAWLWQRQRFPRLRLVFSFLSLITLSSFGGYLHFSQGGNIPDGVLVSSTLLEGLGDGYAYTQSNVALFSTQVRDYDLMVDGSWIDLETVPSRLRAPADSSLVLHEEGSFTRLRFPVREWDYRLFKVRFMSRFPLRAELENQGQQLFLKLSNLTSKDLTDCWLVISGQRFFLGDLPRGSVQIRELALSSEISASRNGQPKRMDLREISFSDTVRDALFRYSFFPQDQAMARWGNGNALFLGWVKEAPRRVWGSDGRILTYEHTLFRAIIPLDGEADL